MKAVISLLILRRFLLKFMAMRNSGKKGGGSI